MTSLCLKIVAFFLVFWLLLLSGCNAAQKPIADMSITELQNVVIE